MSEEKYFTDPINGRVYLDDFSHLKKGDIYKGKIIEGITEDGYPHSNGRNLVKNTFLPGNNYGKGRIKGSRNKLTQQMLDAVANANIKPHEFLIDVMEMATNTTDERLKAAMKLVDIVYPKAASIEVDMSLEEETSPEEMMRVVQSILEKTKEDNKTSDTTEN